MAAAGAWGWPGGAAVSGVTDRFAGYVLYGVCRAVLAGLVTPCQSNLPGCRAIVYLVRR